MRLNYGGKNPRDRERDKEREEGEREIMKERIIDERKRKEIKWT